MELIDVLHQISQQSQHASQPCDLVIGTVVSDTPLKISINVDQAPLQAPVLLLTSAVIEKKIDVLTHDHHNNTISDDLTDIACYENGKKLPVENGYIILNKKLEKGDKVLLLRVQKGQRFIVISRVFEVN